MLDRLKTTCLLTALALFLGLYQSAEAQEANNNPPSKPLPLSSPTTYPYMVQPLSIVQQRAKFEADQRMLRLEWNNWIGYSPSRPNMNASYLSNGLQSYYIPSRGVIVSAGRTRSWYW